MEDTKPDYEIIEIFDEILEDDSWEPDRATREFAIFGLRFGFVMD